MALHRLSLEWSGWKGLSAEIPLDEGTRLAALRDYAVFDTPPEESFDRVTRLVSRVLRVPTALVSLIGEDRQWLKSCIGLPGIRETSRNVAFCAHTILHRDVMVVPDAALDPRFSDNPLVTGWPHIRFYMGVPLTTPSGYSLGSLCAIDTVPRQPTEDDLQTLRELGAMVVDELELRRALREGEERRVALAEARTEFRHLAESIQGMVFQVAQRGPMHFEYEFASIGAIELFGLFPETIVEDRLALRRVIHPDDLAGAYVSLERSLREGRPWLWEGRAVLSDGTRKWVRGVARAERRDSETTVWRGVFMDTTEIKTKELALQEAKEEAERASRAKGEFLSRMSHELRTPLNAILGFAQTLGMEPLSADAHEDLEEIGRAGRRLLAMINDVLDLAKPDAKESEATLEPVSVCETLIEAYGLLRPLMDRRGICLRAVHRCDRSRVLVVPGRLLQAFINVLTNGVKYNREEGALHVRTSVEEDGFVTVAITDEGAGIPEDRKEGIFTAFDRLGAETSGVEGSGLGLAITQGLVESMGGTIEVESAIGKGSTFMIRIPTYHGPQRMA